MDLSASDLTIGQPTISFIPLVTSLITTSDYPSPTRASQDSLSSKVRIERFKKFYCEIYSIRLHDTYSLKFVKTLFVICYGANIYKCSMCTLKV